MNRTSWIKTLAFVLCLVPALGVAPNAGAQQADGGDTCAASSECATPRPHCHPTLHACVECVGDRNCKAGRICKLDEGVCAECRSNADCSPLRPYCVGSQGECVECLTTANCGDSGIVCQGGKCGSCGDGICGPREVISRLSFEPVPVDDGIATCPEDCVSLCPTSDAGSGFGVFAVSTTGLRNLSFGGCGSGRGLGVDAFFKWKAPHEGSFEFSARNASITRFEGGCSGFAQECTSGGGSILVSAAAGAEVVVMLQAEDPAPATLELEIGLPPTPGCDSSPCTPPDAGKGGAALCLANAQDRGDAMCSGVECACNHCPKDYDDCKVIPGCGQITECMREKDCIGADCYNSGACRGVIDSFGGVSGPAFRASSGLKSCALTFDCALPCESEADAGPADAGRLCTPSGSVSCSCGDRAGTKRCAADGMQFDSCNCAAAPSEDESDGCGCRLAGASGTPSIGAALGLALALAVTRRRRGAKRNLLVGRIR
jgi:MYXO-CTERM domain-containing protein